MKCHRHKYEVLASTIKQGVIVAQTCRCVKCRIIRVESDPKDNSLRDPS